MLPSTPHQSASRSTTVCAPALPTKNRLKTMMINNLHNWLISVLTDLVVIGSRLLLLFNIDKLVSTPAYLETPMTLILWKWLCYIIGVWMKFGLFYTHSEFSIAFMNGSTRPICDFAHYTSRAWFPHFSVGMESCARLLGAYQPILAKSIRIGFHFISPRIGGKHCFPCWFTLLHISYV